MNKQPYINSITIENFRVFSKLKGDNFGKINLITGMNNSGKTSLLEAIYLSLGPTNPGLLLQLNARRGIDTFKVDQPRLSYLHHNLDTSKPIVLQVSSLTGENYKLTYKYSSQLGDNNNSTEFTIREGESPYFVETDNVDLAKTMRLVYEPEDGNPTESKIIFSKLKEPQIVGVTHPIFNTSVFVSTGEHFGVQAQGERYTELDKQNLIPKFQELLRHLEPNLIRTSLLVENDIAMIHADTGFGLLPINSSGSGTYRFAVLLLAISHSKNAIVMIDEIENGFHYGALDNVWSSLAEYASQFNCQLFATTHSDECIRAAFNVFKDNKESEFMLHRLVSQEEKSEIHSFDIEQMDAALETGWNLR